MSRKRMIPVGNKFWEKMTTYMMLMGYPYPGDGQVNVTKDLNRRVWKRKRNLSLKRCQRLLYILYSADNYTLLSYTVGLGRIVWNSHLKAKRRKLEKYLAEKIKRRSDKKKLRVMKKIIKRKETCGVPKICKRYQIRPNLGSKLRVAMRRSQTRHCAEVEFGSPMYRFAMALYVLSFRNLCVNSEWEFWAICITKEVCGFWKSIAFGEGLSDSLIPRANELGLYVVSQQVLERLESCYGCSSSVCQSVPIPNGSERILRRKSKA